MKKTISSLGRKKMISGVLIGIAVIGVIVYFAFGKSGNKYQFVNVTQGSITEEVTVTGNTTPIESLDLGFQNGGTIGAVYKKTGDSVASGDVIARLNTNDLTAQLAQAQASVDTEIAKLKKLQAGPTPENLQVSKVQLAAAQQTLANTYAGVSDTLQDAYAKANDAIRNQLASLFSNAETNNPQLTFNVSDSQVANNANFERIQASTELNAWQNELTSISAISASSNLDQALQNASAHLAIIKILFTTVSQAINGATSLSAATATSYKTSAATGLTAANAGLTEVNNTTQSIASEKVNVTQLQAQLNVTLAGATQEDIAAQQAQVAQAQANQQGIQVKINEASLVSPINGIITVQNAKVGEIAAPGNTLVSVISNDNLEIDANIPETDIGKVQVSNPVKITLDAFPGETFMGKVFYIDPAQTTIGGVVDYKMKVSFDRPDPRVKSGLTANLDIQTKTEMNALILPQFAILQNSSGTFVEVLQNGTVAQVPVTLGIHDQSGNVEITSGVTSGEQVLNIGLKAQ